MKTRMGNFIVGAMLVILITGSIGYADLSTGLVAYYPFNGNALDESGNSNHGTLQGDASTVWDPGGNGKPAGWVLSLDGNGDYVRVPDSATILPTTKGTVVTWFKTDPSMFRGWDGEYGLIAKMRYSSSPLGSEFEMRYSRYPYPTGDVLHCYLSDNTGWDRRYTYSSLDMADGVWHSLFVTWEAPVGEASYKMYLDGVTVGTYETVNCSHQGIIEKSPPIPMYIGRRMHDSTPQWYWDFKGMMDEVRIYSRALSAEEIRQLLAIHVDVDIKPGSCPNPLNVKDKGLLSVAVCGSADFDVWTIDAASIRLEGVAPVRSSYEDVATPVADGAEVCECTTAGPDGQLDLTLKFNIQDIVAALGPVNNGDELELTLTGALDGVFGGTPIEGTDCIVVQGAK